MSECLLFDGNRGNLTICGGDYDYDYGDDEIRLLVAIKCCGMNETSELMNENGLFLMFFCWWWWLSDDGDAFLSCSMMMLMMMMSSCCC